MKITAKKSALLLLLGILAMLVVVQAVSAESQSANIFESFRNILGGDFGQTYDTYWWIIDMLVYLFFFGYIGKLALSQQFQGKGSPIGVVFGVALSIALVFFEAKQGFRLGHLGPFALAILLVALAVITWKFFQGFGMGKGAAAAWVVVIIYGFLITIASPLFLWIQKSNNPYLNLVGSILQIGLFISIVAILWNGFGFVSKMFKGGGVGGLSEAFKEEQKEGKKEAAAEQQEKAEESVEEKEERRIQALVNKIEGIEKRNYQEADRMIKDIDEIIKLIQSNKRDASVIEAIRYKLGDISMSEADIKQITAALRGTAAELDAYEKDEVSKATTALAGAQKIAQGEILAELKKSSPKKRALTKAETGKLTGIQKNVEKEIKVQAEAQWILTRKELDTHIASIAAAETQLPNLFTQSVEYLKIPGRMQSAVSTLQTAKGLLGKIKAAIASVEKLDIPKLKQKISRTMKDLQVERNLANRLRNDFLKP